MTTQRDRLESYGDAVRLVHELREKHRQGLISGGEVSEAQRAADKIRDHVNDNRTTPIRKTSWGEKLLGISARATRKEREAQDEFRRARGTLPAKRESFWGKIF